MSYSRGSEWTKWDLHVHTKDTNKNDLFTSSTFDDFCNTMFSKALESNIAVIGITDYFSIENYKKILSYIQNLENNSLVSNEKKEQIKQITLIPNIELRMLPSTGSGRLINIHCLFNPDYISKLDNDFFNAIEFSHGARKYRMNKDDFVNLGKAMGETDDQLAHKKGIDNFVVSHSDLQRILVENEELRNNTIIVTSNKSTDGASGTQQHFDLFENEQSSSLDATRQAIYKLTDMIFSSNKSDIDYFLGLKNDSKEEVRKKCGSLKPCIHGSDAHTESKLFNPDNHRHCWIKANPTFEGLKQVINEPKDRVFIGELPPKLNLVHTNKDKYIEKIIIEKNPDSTESTIWFNNTVELNSDLVAIIGNKGNGKSALADIIALSGHAKLIDHADYSFLNNDRFRKHNLAANFRSTLIWKNGTNTIINLNDEVKETDIEKIKYLPQKYIEKICSSDEYLSFQQEINKVVFSHIKEENKLGKTNLKDLIKEKTQYITDKRTEIINQIKNLIQEHIDLTSKYSKTELSKKENLLREKEQQIADHQKIKAEITIVENPSNNTGLQAQQKEKVTQTEQLSTSINELKKAIDVNQSVLNNLKISKNGLVKIENDLKLEKERFDNNQIILRSQIEQYKLDLDFTKLIEFKINTQLIENAKESIEKSIAALVLKQEQDEIQLKQFLYDQAKLSSELSEPEKAYQTYLDQINLWNQKNQELENEKEIINNELNFAKNELPVHLIGLYRKYIKQYKKLFQTYQEELDIYQEQYKPILDFVATEKDKIKSKKGFINFTAYIAIDRKKLYNSLLFYFDGRRQTFYNDALLDVVSSLEDCNQVSLILLQKKIIRLIKNKGKNPQQQFRDGMELLNFYSSLSDLDYLNIEYDIMLDDKKVNQLSPGERGALLIIFYLLIDKGDIPLVIDQPEDNLDNESVFEYLVPYIKKAKERRQIVIVTHNPNIAVVADAEQIIYSEIDKTQGNTVTYLSGAIEDEIINDKIVKVLEGTMPAFDNRTIKYYRE